MFVSSSSWALCVFSRGTECSRRAFPLYQEEKISVSKTSSFRVKWKYSNAKESGGLSYKSLLFFLSLKDPEARPLFSLQLRPVVCKRELQLVVFLWVGYSGTGIPSHTTQESQQGFLGVCEALELSSKSCEYVYSFLGFHSFALFHKRDPSSPTN